MRLFLAIYFPAYLLVGGVYRIWVVRRQIGKSPVTIMGESTETAHGYLAALAKWIMVAIGAVLALYVLAPSLYEGWLMPLSALELAPVREAGVALLVLSLALVAVAQAQMGRSWRIGIDFAERTELAVAGLYRYSRNPIYVGMLLTDIGLFLALPNAATLVILALGYVSLQLQIRLEEAFLESQHGESYRRFKAGVRRWI